MIGHTRPTLKEIAKKVGVSESAASLALSGKPGVSDATRSRVLQVAEELQWTPNHAARVLSGAPSQTVGFVIARDIEDVGSEAFFLHFITGIQSRMSARGYGLLLQSVASVEEEIALYRQWRSANRVDAVVLVDLRFDDPRPSALAQMDLPAVLTGAADPQGRIPAITLDDAALMRQILDYLRSKGHTRIAYICGDLHLLHIGQRVKEFRAELSNGLVLETDFAPASASEAMSEALDSKDRPTAVIFDNELLAAAGMGEIRARGLSIPEDISVIVWEDSAAVQFMDPPLTALSRDAFALGQLVAQKLLDQINGKKVVDDQYPLAQLVERKSVAKAH